MKKLFLIFALVLIAGGIYISVKYKEPDIQNLLQNSVLNNRKFNVNVQGFTTKSGINGYLISDVNSPIISISFKFKNAGIAYEGDESYGTSNLVAAMLTEGAGDKNAEEYQEFLRQRGVKVSFSAGFDNFDGAFAFPVVEKENVLPVLKDTLYNPRFSQKELDLMKENALLALHTQTENEMEAFVLEAQQRLYRNHPYSRNHLGSEEIIQQTTPEKLKQYMQDYLTKDNFILGISGNVDVRQAEEIAEYLFADLKNSTKIRQLPPVAYDFWVKKYQISKPFAQNKVMLVAEGVSRDDDYFYPLYVANYIFGGSGLNSVLNEELRGKRGLTYGAYTDLQNRNAEARIVGFFETTADNYEQAMQLALEEWQKFGTGNIDKKSLKQAKDYLISSFNLRFASTMDLSSMLVEIQYYNLGADFLNKRNDYIRNLTLEDVNNAAELYFNDSVLVIGMGNIKDEK